MPTPQKSPKVGNCVISLFFQTLHMHLCVNVIKIAVDCSFIQALRDTKSSNATLSGGAALFIEKQWDSQCNR